MEIYDLNRVRYRSLIVAVVLQAVLTAGGAIIAYRLPSRTTAEWVVFVFGFGICFVLLPLAQRAYRRGDRVQMERLGAVSVVLAGLLVLQRIAWATLGPPIADPSLTVFRPIYSFLPFVYLGAVALMRARSALPLCWLSWALATALTLTGLYLHIGLLQWNGSLLLLLLWLLIGNPLFILLLHALPRYEDALERSAAEVSKMRERTELMDRVAESERRFNLVVQSLQVGVWERRHGTEAQNWLSPHCYELLGYRPGELPPGDESIIKIIHPEDKDRVMKMAAAQLQNGDMMDVDARVLTKDHGYRWFNASGKAERDGRGEILRLAGAIADIHDQRVAEQTLLEAKVELTQLAYLDTLTELPNRRAFDKQFLREWKRSQHKMQPLSLLLIDLDYFKSYNDHYGHAAGDSCLLLVAQRIRHCLRRQTDFAARFGGEEFAVLLPETPQAGSLEVASRIVAALREPAIPHEGSPRRVVTASVGVASANGYSPESSVVLFEQADQALYEVKRKGRDGVIHYRGLSKEAPGEAPTAVVVSS